jgi:hypothetical protein
VPKTVKLVRMRSGADRMELMAELVGRAAATAVTGYPPAGVDPLDFVGAGVELLGAGAGAVVGGASVGDGFDDDR